VRQDFRDEPLIEGRKHRTTILNGRVEINRSRNIVERAKDSSKSFVYLGMNARVVAAISVLAIGAIAGLASANSDIPWDGPYLGASAGEASSNACNSRSLNGAMIARAAAFEFNNRDCSNGSALIGGVRMGENFQYKRLVLGVGADLDYWGAEEFNQSLKYSGAVPPPGTYVYSSRQSPSGFAVIAPRIGYAGDTWLPYLEVGAIIAAGSHGSALFYTPPGAKEPTASFNGGKGFSSPGWVAGGGFELGLNGAWSITAEYLHAKFAKESNSTGTCNGSGLTCAAFAGVSLDDIHEGLSANIFRVGFTYWFGYWEP
jgi:opacity protein-like surface antigen